VTGHGGPLDCVTLRLSHSLDNRLTDVSEVVSLMRRPFFIPQEDSWYSFLLEAGSTPGPPSIEKSNDFIGVRTRDLPACGIVPQPTIYIYNKHETFLVNDKKKRELLRTNES
jgi:hypothetical protein